MQLQALNYPVSNPLVSRGHRSSRGRPQAASPRDALIHAQHDVTCRTPLSPAFTVDGSCCDQSPSSSPFARTREPLEPTQPGASRPLLSGGLGSDFPALCAGVGLQFRPSTVAELSEEVQDLQLLGKGGYGLVATGVWRQEGRVAVKLLLNDVDTWLNSSYKEALVSRMLAHPNVLQTYDFRVAVITQEDHAAVQQCWRDQQRSSAEARTSSSGALGGSGACGLQPGDLRADSFELPAMGMVDNAVMRCNSGTCLPSPKVSLYQMLFTLGARVGQYVTLIIMEYAEVGTLQRAIANGAFREGPRLSRWAALRSLLVTAKEVAGCMCLLHNLKIIHGDLTPGNILLKASRIDKRGFVAKVADFGLAKVTCCGTARMEDWCTVAYMAPEVTDYEARLESDVYSFGVCLWAMATGQVPFAGLSPAQVVAGRMVGDLHLEWPADAPADVRALACRCMEAEPSARPSFREIVDELKRMDADARTQHRLAHASRRRAMKAASTDMLFAGALGGSYGPMGFSGSIGSSFGGSTGTARPPLLRDTLQGPSRALQQQLLRQQAAAQQQQQALTPPTPATPLAQQQLPLWGSGTAARPTTAAATSTGSGMQPMADRASGSRPSLVQWASSSLACSTTLRAGTTRDSLDSAACTTLNTGRTTPFDGTQDNTPTSRVNAGTPLSTAADPGPATAASHGACGGGCSSEGVALSVSLSHNLDVTLCGAAGVLPLTPGECRCAGGALAGPPGACSVHGGADVEPLPAAACVATLDPPSSGLRPRNSSESGIRAAVSLSAYLS